MAERSVVRELVTLLGFDIDDKKLKAFDERIARVRKNLRRMAIAGGIAAAVLTGLVVKTTRLGDNLVKTSKRLGLSIEELQKWRFAFQQAGVSEQTFDMAVQRFGRRAAEAAKGTGEAVKALHELGIELVDDEGNLRKLDDLLNESLDALTGFAEGADRNRLAMKLFDSEGVRLVQGLEEGNKALKANKQLLEDLGAVMSDEAAMAAEELADEWGVLKAAILGVVISIGAELIPMVTSVIKAIRNWFKDNKKLASLIVTITVSILAMTSVMFGMIAVTTLWNLKLLILNTTLGALLIKILLLPALLASVAAAAFIIGEDISIGLAGSGNSIFGLIMKGIDRLFAFVKSKAKEFSRFILNQVQATLDQLPEPVKRFLSGATGARVGYAPQPGTPGPAAFTRQAASGAGGGQIYTGPVDRSLSILVNAAPGQSPKAIASEVAIKITDISRSALVGLGK